MANYPWNDDTIAAYRNGWEDGLNIKHNMSYSIFGMNMGKALDILSDHLRKSSVPDIPIGFKFNWNDREKINEWFGQLSKQGYKVVKE